jgi:hypothetical protein
MARVVRSEHGVTPVKPGQWSNAHADPWNLAGGSLDRDWVQAWRDLRAQSQVFDLRVDPESFDAAFLIDVLSASALLAVLAFCATALRTVASKPF